VQLVIFLLLAIGMIVWGAKILKKNKVNPDIQKDTSGRRIGGLILISLGIVATAIIIFLSYFFISFVNSGPPTWVS